MESATVALKIKIWVRRLIKTLFFILLSIAVGRFLGDPEVWINYDFAEKVAGCIYAGVNAETIYDTYFYISFLTVIFITITIYILVIKLISFIRSY
ncbi:hypothetical protein LMA04_07800 [Pseudescherichia vulneris]|uniref:hypothetical protein n=1 Tax=Pseudescherichia vulneris TaxID=566 RepID=UPI00227B6570|nr:hypothetical protein [Pseudescherichia vulneris]WAH53925.1 hypothetical protein LMA04_07800 [Pseudescherichia vulneris]